jgi:RNA polymerase sigma-70 factor (ECF subfamily)
MVNPDDPVTSATLLRHLRDPDNNEEAWRTFLGAYNPLIFRWCRRVGLNSTDAEDVSAAVLCKLAQALRNFSYDPAHRFRGWLKTVVENAVRNYWRELEHRPGARGNGDSAVQHKLEQLQTPAEIEDLVRELDDSLSGEVQRAQQIAARVRERVKPVTWDAFWRTAIEERPAAEVAAQLGLTVTSVYVAKNRVGKLLRVEAAKLQALAPGAREG